MLPMNGTMFIFHYNSEILLKRADLRPDYSIFTYTPDHIPRRMSDAPKVNTYLLLKRGGFDSKMRMEGGGNRLSDSGVAVIGSRWPKRLGYHHIKASTNRLILLEAASKYSPSNHGMVVRYFQCICQI